MRTEDDEYFDKVQALSERLTGDDPDERIRQIAREETDKRILALTRPLLWAGAIWWANHEFGSQGLWVAIGAGIAWLILDGLRQDFDPKHDRHLVVSQAEDLNRLMMIDEAFAAGEQVWFVKDKEYERDTRKVHVFDNDRWDSSWRRIHNTALELERLSPRARRKRVRQAAQKVRVPLEQGEALAKREQAELTFWARNFLVDMRRS